MHGLGKIGALAGALAIATSHAAAVPPVEAFGNLPLVSQPKLSPDGKHIAMIQPLDGRPAVVIYTVGAPPGTRPAGVKDSSGVIQSAEWANNDRLLVFTLVNRKKTGDAESAYGVLSVDASGGNQVVLLQDSSILRGTATEVSDLDLDDPGHVFMPAIGYTANGWRNSLYRVDVTTGSREFVRAGNPDTYGWIMDGHGHVVGRLNETSGPLTDHLEVLKGDSWKEIGTYDATGGHSANIAGLSDDGASFVHFAVSTASGTDVLTRLDPATGKETALFANPKYDVDNTLRDPWTRRVIGATYVDDKSEYQYFDPEMQNLQLGLEAAFPGLSVHAVSWDLTKQKLIVAAEGPTRPLTYYYLDRQTHQATKIAPTYPDLHEADLGQMKSYAYKARDGLEIPAYLTLPPNKAQKNLPTVIFPHGGPMDRDKLNFDWIAAFLASRGYAVLQPNFRGSSGYGEKFASDGFGQWGLKMQDDVTDGVKKLIADGIADPKRICIVGASYGGYAALEGAVSTPDLYACAVSFAGVSDLRKFLETRANDFGWRSWMIATWYRYIGDRSADKAKLDEASPALHADRVKCPVLLIHGASDVTVRIDQSEAMRDALLGKGKSVRFVRIDTENHYMELADTRIRFLRETEAFLAQNIGN